jgi:hypothetical protein
LGSDVVSAQYLVLYERRFRYYTIQRRASRRKGFMPHFFEKQTKFPINKEFSVAVWTVDLLFCV